MRDVRLVFGIISGIEFIYAGEKCWIVLTPKTTQTHKIKSKAFKPQSNIYAYKGQGNLLNTSI